MTNNDAATTTVWLTEYAMTRGIIRADNCTVKHSGHVGRGVYCQPDYVSATIGRTAFLTEAEAIADAIKRGRAKLRGIEKQRRKIEGLIEGWESAEGRPMGCA